MSGKFEAATEFVHEGRKFKGGECCDELPKDTITAGLRMGYVRERGKAKDKPDPSPSARPRDDQKAGPAEASAATDKKAAASSGKESPPT